MKNTFFRRAIMVSISAVLIILSLQTYSYGVPNDDKYNSARIMVNLGVLRGWYCNEPPLSEQIVARIQAAVIILRMCGLEEEARNFEPMIKTYNFRDGQINDIPGDSNILAYLKCHPELGWIGGKTDTFEPFMNITARQVYKVLLVTLGYEYGTDFNYANTMDFAESLRFKVELDANNELSLLDFVDILADSLRKKMKSSNETLIEYLVDTGKIDSQAAKECGLIQ